MNRRQFVRDSLISGVSGLASGSSLVGQRAASPEKAEPAVQPTASAMKHRVYAHLLDPREHPDYTRRHVRPPSWDTFDGRTRLMALRNFKIEGNRIVQYAEEIKKYTQDNQLATVIWPMYPIIYAENLGDLADEIKRQKLFLFDIWAYVPGSGPGGVWQQFHPPAGALDLLESKLGDHWLGMDNGEQDGRYIGGYASQFYPASSDKSQQYLNFQRHFERLTDELGNKMATLVSLNFGHYFLKEGVYTFIGAETGQALPNSQIFYAFIRGAGKQYGVPWFGNASVWNRWGWKLYGPEVHDGGMTGGPTRGTSLSLLKRLLYSQILYNSMMVGFETSYFTCASVDLATGACEGEKLAPIGQLQQAVGKWIREAGPPGAMLTPVAVMLDFFAGWTFPRHLYTSDVYRVWGNLPYGPGDYLTDAVLDMLYPGYQDSSYFHDESGFLAPTPYGDAADCLLSDAPGWLLDRYPMMIVAGELAGGAETRDKFEAYVKRGGHLLITAGNLAKLPDGLAGIRVSGGINHFGAGTVVTVGETKMVEDSPFGVQALTFPKTARVLGESSGVPIVLEIAHGKGRITIFASPFGVIEKQGAGVGAALAEDVKNEVDKSLAKPYTLLKHVRNILDQALRSQRLFEVGDGVSFITCRKGPGEYVLDVSNNTWREQPLKIVSNCGRIESLRELALDQSEKGAVGYLPEGMEKADLGVSDAKHIAGGDVRMFAVKVSEEGIEEIAHVAPPARPRGRALPLREARSIKEEVLARPSFFEHFDSVAVDWRYLQRCNNKEMSREARWIGLQGLKVLIDLSSGINLYPDLRLVDNLHEDFLASMAAIDDVVEKMEILRASDLILSLHRYPENNFTRAQTWESFETTLREVCLRAQRRQLTVHLRLAVGRPPEDLKKAADFVGRVGASNFFVAPCTSFLLAKKAEPSEISALFHDKIGLWLVSAPQTDLVREVWNSNAPIRTLTDRQCLAKILSVAPQAPVVLDGVYRNHDEEYLDAKVLQEMLVSIGSKASQNHQRSGDPPSTASLAETR